MISKFGDLKHTPCGLMGRKAAGRTMKADRWYGHRLYFGLFLPKGSREMWRHFCGSPWDLTVVELGSSQQVQTKFPESWVDQTYSIILPCVCLPKQNEQRQAEASSASHGGSTEPGWRGTGREINVDKCIVLLAAHRKYHCTHPFPGWAKPASTGSSCVFMYKPVKKFRVGIQVP